MDLPRSLPTPSHLQEAQKAIPSWPSQCVSPMTQASPISLCPWAPGPPSKPSLWSCPFLSRQGRFVRPPQEACAIPQALRPTTLCIPSTPETLSTAELDHINVSWQDSASPQTRSPSTPRAKADLPALGPGQGWCQSGVWEVLPR